MAGVNKVIILGNLGMDPEVRTLESGAKLARLRIATSESYTEYRRTKSRKYRVAQRDGLASIG